MISFPNAKINLGLHITSKRPDGYHELETVFYPVNWCDALEIIVQGNKPIDLSFSGLTIQGALEKNLCYKAWQLINKDFKLPNLQVHLHKVIPMGAGLGGGSADAAFMLTQINSVCDLKISDAQLKNYASQLGSDCVFFIENKPAIATGRGELLEMIDVILKNLQIVIVMPPLTVGTAEAYSWITPKQPQQSLKSIIQKPIEQWKEFLINDFEIPVCERYPLIAEIKQQLYDAGAMYAAMSGSGAAVFGIFNGEPTLPAFPKETQVYSGLM